MQPSKKFRTKNPPLLGLLWIGLLFTVGVQIVLAVAPPSAYAWVFTCVAGIVDLVVVVYLTSRIRTERKVTRIYQATSHEDRAVLRWGSARQSMI
jgi:hypothetical protein